jgi:hypothetical protein
MTQSADANLSGLYLDLVLSSDKEELFVENKVGDELRAGQLRNYLNYASERGNAHVAVASRGHNPVVDEYQGRNPQFIGEMLWWELADRWKKRGNFSNPDLIKGVLEFMKEHHMGAFEPFRREETTAANLWSDFADKRDRILSRLGTKISQPTWSENRGLKWSPEYPDPIRKEALIHRGVLWCSPVESPPGNCDFWYFLGFRYGAHPSYPPLLEQGQAECIVFVGAWPPQKIGKSRGLVSAAMVQEASRLKGDDGRPLFEVGDSENRQGIFLFRRRQLKDFIGEEDQAAAILGFLERSHRYVESAVPRIHDRFREAT